MHQDTSIHWCQHHMPGRHCDHIQDKTSANSSNQLHRGGIYCSRTMRKIPEAYSSNFTTTRYTSERPERYLRRQRSCHHHGERFQTNRPHSPHRNTTLCSTRMGQQRRRTYGIHRHHSQSCRCPHQDTTQKPFLASHLTSHGLHRSTNTPITGLIKSTVHCFHTILKYPLQNWGRLSVHMDEMDVMEIGTMAMTYAIQNEGPISYSLLTRYLPVRASHDSNSFYRTYRHYLLCTIGLQ